MLKLNTGRTSKLTNLSVKYLIHILKVIVVVVNIWNRIIVEALLLKK